MTPKGKSNIILKVDNEIGSCKTEWDSFLPEQSHLTSINLQPFENNSDCKSVYIRAYNQNELIGVAYCQIVVFSENEVNYDNISSKKATLGLKTFFKLSCDLSFLVCGNMFRTSFQGFYIKDISVTVFEILRQFQTEYSTTYKLSGLIVKESFSIATDDEYKSQGFMELGEDSMMRMEIKEDFKTLDGYSKKLSKKYRKRFQKIQNDGKDLIIKDFEKTDLEEKKDQIFKLYKQTLQNQTIKIGKLLPNYYIDSYYSLGDKFSFKGIYENEELIAFMTFISINNECIDVHYVGFDYKKNEQYSLYFNILFWALEVAILGNYKYIRFGRTAETAKMSLGAVPIPQNNYVFFINSALKLSFKTFRNIFLNKNLKALQVRSPFKTE